MDNNYNARVLRMNAELEKAVDALDPADPKYLEKLKAIQGLYQRLNEDNKNAIDEATAFATLETEKSKTRTQAIFDGVKNVVAILGIAAGVGTVVYQERNLNRRFDTSTKFEEENAYLTTTQKETVRQALQDKTEKQKFKLF